MTTFVLKSISTAALSAALLLPAALPTQAKTADNPLLITVKSDRGGVHSPTAQAIFDALARE